MNNPSLQKMIIDMIERRVNVTELAVNLYQFTTDSVIIHLQNILEKYSVNDLFEIFKDFNIEWIEDEKWRGHQFNAVKLLMKY